jgi:hypothetical protein
MHRGQGRAVEESVGLRLEAVWNRSEGLATCFERCSFLRRGRTQFSMTAVRHCVMNDKQSELTQLMDSAVGLAAYSISLPASHSRYRYSPPLCG